MRPGTAVTVEIDLARVCTNAESIRRSAGVPVIAVVKADAYGLGIDRVAPALSTIVDRFCVFSLAEAAAARLKRLTGKMSLSLGPGDPADDVDAYVEHGVRPAVWDATRAAALRRARPILSVDTGMQRFACAPAQIDAVLAAGGCDEAFTHATGLDRVRRLLELVGDRGLTLHAAGSSLIHEQAARLDAVRPGLALYRGAARVSARLVEVRKSAGPAGYTGFLAPHHGVILGGYSNGLRPGPCIINGRRSRVLEVGMQSAFVETAEGDRVGDEVVLLGYALTEAEVAAEWRSSPQEVLVRLCAAGRRAYRDA